VVIAATAESRWCVYQRPRHVVNGGLWEFPSVEMTPDRRAQPVDVARDLFRIPVDTPEYLATIRHAITRYRVVQHAYVLQLPRIPSARGGAGEWRSLGELDELAFSSAHRRIVRALSGG
jgi:adenine-specific DNA glycosylase